jgi:hypothetical protein
MKKFVFLLMALPLLFTACGEDEETFVQQNYLVGKWEITQTGTMNAQGAINYTNYVNDANCDKDNYIFNADLTYQQNDFVNSGTCTNQSISGTYNRLSTSLTLRYTTNVGGTPQVVNQSLTIVSLTYTEIVVAYTTSNSNQLVYLKMTKV